MGAPTLNELHKNHMSSIKVYLIQGESLILRHLDLQGSTLTQWYLMVIESPIGFLRQRNEFTFVGHFHFTRFIKKQPLNE